MITLITQQMTHKRAMKLNKQNELTFFCIKNNTSKKVLSKSTLLVTFSLFIISLFFFQSCNNEKKKDENAKPKQTSSKNKTYRIDSLKQFVLMNGDWSAYEELFNDIFVDDSQEYFLFWALIMSNKYNDPAASFDVFYSMATCEFSRGTGGVCYKNIDGVEIINLDHLDNTSREMALTYLKKAADLKNPEALRIMGEYYKTGIYFQKNESVANQLINQSQKLLNE